MSMRLVAQTAQNSGALAKVTHYARSMTRLTPERYLDHIAIESRLFRDALAQADPAAGVPSCPEWNASDLLWHLAQVQHFWNFVIVNRPKEPEQYDEPPRPSGHRDLLARFDSWSAALQKALAIADCDDAAWSWDSEQTVAFTLRRQAHEALIHRIDAEQVTGSRTPIDRYMAADGVNEVLTVFYGGCPTWAELTEGSDVVEVALADTGESTWVRPGAFSGTSPASGLIYDQEPIVDVLPDAPSATATIAGSAEDVLLWLWKRGDDTPLTMNGDPEAIAAFIAGVSAPLD
jgi:uncharacterized protein (TIGR03083 family)